MIVHTSAKVGIAGFLKPPLGSPSGGFFVFPPKHFFFLPSSPWPLPPQLLDTPPLFTDLPLPFPGSPFFRDPCRPCFSDFRVFCVFRGCLSSVVASSRFSRVDRSNGQQL